MANEELEVQEAALQCGVRMVQAPDGAQIPVPSGEVAGVTDAHGVQAVIPDDAAVQISQVGNGYYVVMNCAPPENNEAGEIAEDLAKGMLEEALEQAFLATAPKVLKAGLSVLGIAADVLTTSKLTREVFIRGEYQGVPLKYCVLL